ncbi:hypothetical protein RUM44_001167 [Polyplax serrata]|uniref:Uncharacterized protein n=1 Tax=Polyplax serrata TaxID=468196 RepID=A0ABR1B6R8_POLSC
MNLYYYLDVLFKIECNEKLEIDVYKLKQIITDCIRTLFGEVGVANPVDILKFEETTGRIILRCFADFYVKLRASLSFGHKFGNIPYSFYVTKASASLLSLEANSKTYEF